jgi:hypothetical protein
MVEDILREWKLQARAQDAGSREQRTGRYAGRLSVCRSRPTSKKVSSACPSRTPAGDGGVANVVAAGSACL